MYLSLCTETFMRERAQRVTEAMVRFHRSMVAFMVRTDDAALYNHLSAQVIAVAVTEVRSFYFVVVVVVTRACYG